MPLPDSAACYRALRTHDARFDGRLFVGVTTTGVYCRPVCPAPPPRAGNCKFFPTAAAAHEAGFRPCLRCRPETAPEHGAWRGTSSTVSRGLALIAEGELDGADASVDALAERLGVGERQLRRLFRRHLGASPVAVAQTRRVHFAKQLIHETAMPMSEIALASGFGSVRRFNETFLALFRRPPSALRRTMHARVSAAAADGGVTVLLRYRAPYDWDAVLAHFAARAVDGVERVEGGTYRRVVREGGAVGVVEVAHVPERNAVAATIRVPAVSALLGLSTRVRRVFDLDADVAAIGAHLARDPLLAPRVASRPGLRVPGGWDGFELAVRAVLGQQVTVAAARGLAGALVRACGTRIRGGVESGLTHAFPDAAQVARADLSSLRMPDARRRALVALARASLADPDLFAPRESVEETVAALRAIPGIGEWTAQYVALRAAREPDAFPAGDAGLQRAAARRGTRPTTAALLARAERWRPWRGYAAQHLWTAHTERSDDE